MLIPTNFHTNATDPRNPVNDEQIFEKYGNATCRFSSLSGKSVVTQGFMLHYPLKEGQVPELPPLSIAGVGNA